MKLIPLTGKYAVGKYSHAIVDDEDYEELSQYSWKAKPNANKTQVYAIRVQVDSQKISHDIRMHREILGIPFDGVLVTDHINRNPIDNRRRNIRLTSRSENRKNITEDAVKNFKLAAELRKGKYESKYKKWICDPHVVYISFEKCQRCGTIFRRKKEKQKFCTSHCRWTSNRKYQDRRKTQWSRETKCSECGKKFEKRQPNHYTCSILCRRLRDKRLKLLK